ncbi:MAG: Cys-Gln thioester bond-forming surface protein, partial [Oscillospiraceae bacterium]|nr:Cys-Gln thioester bond-forming surface protein [Oscillospiraceae bacterium]
MKLKKVILVVLLALIVGIVIASKAYASASMELGIVSLREGGYGYSANTKNVWKIVEYQNGKYNYNNAIYCLRGGPGFGNSSYIENRVYNVSYNLKEYSTIPDSIKGILPSDGEQTYTSGGQTYTYTNYNAVLALLDNLYLPKDANAANFKQQLIKMAFPTLDPSDFVLTDDDIEVVQQCALWYFTNSDPSNVDQYAYHFETLPELQLTQTEGGQGPFNLTLDDLDSTWQRQDQASKLYNFLIDLAKKTASNYGNGDTRSVDTAPAEIADTNATSEINNGKIIVGPFRIEDNGNTSYDITAEVKDQNDNNLGYTILDENKQPIATGTTLKDLANKDFYVSVNNDVNISSVKVNISIGYSVTTPTFYTVGGSELIEQPVVVVDRTKQEESKEVEIPVKKEYDLSLRKFITSINGVSPTVSRTPVIDTTKLEDGTDTTAIYTQPKNALEVNTGDTVLYTIRIYNEGDFDGKATEVTDYLPAGLTLKAGSSINNTYGWTQNGQAITTTYLA